MRSTRLLHFTLVFLLALIFISGCTAATNDLEAGSSSTHQEAVPERPTIEGFVKKVDLQRIGQPISNDKFQIDFARDIPVFDGRPIINIDEGAKSLATAEYLLGRYSTVILLEPFTHRPLQVTYRNGKIEPLRWKDYEESEQAYDEYVAARKQMQFDPDLNAFRRHVLNDARDVERLKELPPPISTEYLPHHDDIPIIEAGPNALNRMAYAYRNTQPQAFWFVKGDSAASIKGQAWPTAPESQTELQTLKTAPTRFSAAKLKYGSSIASLLHGHSIRLDDVNEVSRERGPSLKEYPRFGPSASRGEMIAALQKYGRFRYYDKAGDFTGPFKVKLRNLNSAPSHAMIIDVQPLTRYEQWQEKFFETFRGLKLPV